MAKKNFRYYLKINKFRIKTQSNIDTQNATWYIKRFDQLRTSKAVDIKNKVAALDINVKDPLDIKTYTWSNLERIVDQFQDTRKVTNNVNADKDLIYNQNNLQIPKLTN
mgnify:CR=1 FL=1